MRLRAGSLALLSLLAAHPLTAQRATENLCRVVQPLTPLPGLREASGLAMSRRGPTRLFAINDSARPEVVVLNQDGSPRGRVTLEGVSVTDWEDVTTGPCPDGTCLFVADVGDNDARRQGITVYRVAEPPDGVESLPADRLDFVYPDGPHDAEALFTSSEGRLLSADQGTSRVEAISPSAASGRSADHPSTGVRRGAGGGGRPYPIRQNHRRRDVSRRGDGGRTDQ
jgi:hypothetical protein